MISHGHGRCVLCIGCYALKFASPRHGARAFLLGQLSNYREREVSRCAGDDPRLAKAYWLSWLGLLLISERIEPLRRSLTESEAAGIPLTALDPKLGNHGQRPDGTIAAIDYGHSDCWWVGPSPHDLVTQEAVR